MLVLVIEEYVRRERLQNLMLGNTPEEEGFVDADIPGAKGPNDPLMRRAIARCHQRGANRRICLCRVTVEVEL